MIVPPGVLSTMTDEEILAAYAEMGLPEDYCRACLRLLREGPPPGMVID